ncbi:hypothetical protein HKX48_000570 [Thoreauomyces humboldtii]|nr:hypothetical protein HKX48_000570 [Thoreauomyces humboldtii]
MQGDYSHSPVGSDASYCSSSSRSSSIRRTRSAYVRPPPSSPGDTSNTNTATVDLDQLVLDAALLARNRPLSGCTSSRDNLSVAAAGGGCTRTRRTSTTTRRRSSLDRFGGDNPTTATTTTTTDPLLLVMMTTMDGAPGGEIGLSGRQCEMQTRQRPPTAPVTTTTTTTRRRAAVNNNNGGGGGGDGGAAAVKRGGPTGRGSSLRAGLRDVAVGGGGGGGGGGLTDAEMARTTSREMMTTTMGAHKDVTTGDVVRHPRSVSPPEKPSEICDDNEEEDEEEDGPAAVSEVVRARSSSSNPKKPSVPVAMYDPFFDDISGWGEDEPGERSASGATYQYLTLDGGDGLRDSNQSPGPGPDVVRRLKRLYHRKRTSRPAKDEGGNGARLSRQQKQSRLRRSGCGEEDDDGDRSNLDGDGIRRAQEGQAAEEAEAALHATGSMPGIPPMQRPASSIPSKARAGARSAALEHVSLNSAAQMVPRVTEKRRPATAKRPVPTKHLTPHGDQSSPGVPPPDNMAQVRKKLLSSARTNNRNVAVPTSDTADIPVRSQASGALGSAVITGTKYCSGSFLSGTDKKNLSRHWTSSGSISEPLTLPSPQPSITPAASAGQQAASTPITESSLTALPLIKASSTLNISVTTTPEQPAADDVKHPQSSQQQSLPQAPCKCVQAGQSTSQLPYSLLSPPPPSDVPKWLAGPRFSRSQHRSATLDRYSATLLLAPGTNGASVLTGSPNGLAPCASHDRQLKGIQRRPVKKLSQNGFQAVGFWDDEGGSGGAGIGQHEYGPPFGGIQGGTIRSAAAAAASAVAGGGGVGVAGTFVPYPTGIPMPAEAGDSTTLGTSGLSPLGSRSFRDSICLSRTTNRATVI